MPFLSQKSLETLSQTVQETRYSEIFSHYSKSILRLGTCRQDHLRLPCLTNEELTFIFTLPER